jgi:hypothetical protein
LKHDFWKFAVKQGRLYQKGAQKVIRFNFSTSVAIDMTEQILTAASKTEN